MNGLQSIAARRWRLSLILTAATLVVYLGFLILLAFDKPLMGHLLAPGFSLAIAIGVSVILYAVWLTWLYVRWANTHYDAAIAKVKQGQRL